VWPPCLTVEDLTLKSSGSKIKFDLDSLPAAGSHFKLLMNDAPTLLAFDLVGKLGSRIVSVDLKISLPKKVKKAELDVFDIHAILDGCPQLRSVSIELPGSIDKKCIGKLSAQHFKNLSR
jgi:hypothetical protein